MVRPVVPTTPHRTPTSSRGPPTSTTSATSATSSSTTATTTPKAYKWRQPSHDDDDDDGEQAHPSCSWPHSHSSASPTDVRQLQPLQPLQYPLTPHSEASVSASASASSATEPGASRSSSLATAAPHEDDSSIDSKSPLVSYHTTIHANYNYNGTPLLTSKTALPPLGTDSSDNDTDEEHHHHHYLRDYYSYRDYSGASHLPNSEISSTVPPVVVDEHRPPHPQHEEQHPCKKLQPEVDVHPSKKRDEKPQQLQQPLELHEQHSARLLPRASEASGVSGALLECVQLAAAQWYDESLDKEEFWETSNNNSNAGAGLDKEQDTALVTTTSTKKSTLDHAPSSVLMQEEEEEEVAGEPSASLASLQEELAIAEKSFESSESLSVLLQPPSMEDENDDYNDYNDNPPELDNVNNNPQQQHQQHQQPSGYSMVGGTWKDSPADLVLFLDDEDEDDNDGEHHPNDANLSGFSNSSVESSIVILHSTTTTTTTTTDDTNSSQDAQATAREEIVGKKTTAPQNNNSGRQKEIAVAPRDPSLEGSRTVSGNWNEDLQATRLEFVDDNNNSNDVIQQSLHQSLQEIRVPPRNSKPVVLRGDLLKEYMNSAELIFRSKDDLHLVTKPSQTSSSTSSTLASAAARKRTLQRKSLPRHHDVTVQPPVSSSSSSHGFFAKPQNSVQNNNSNDSTNSNNSSSNNNHNHHREINVQPRRSKPLVLKGDLKEYMENAKLLYQSGRDDFHVLTPSMLSKSKPVQQPKPLAVQNSNNNSSNKSLFLSQHSEPTVLSSNRRNHLHMLVDDEDDKNRPENTCAKTGERNEIKVEPRRSKPVVLRGNLKEYMQNTDLIFQSKDDLHIVPQLQRKLSRDEILVEPQAVENRILSDTQVHDILPLDDTEAEIQVEPRRLKPFVLRGNLKEYMATAHLHFRSKDDLDVMPRFQRQNQQQQQSQTEITVEPLDCEIRRVLSNDVSEIMPLNDEDNEIIVKPRRSKPFVLRGDLKEYMDTADLIFRSDDDWAVMDKRGGGAVAEEKTEILVEPREGESIAVSGDLKDYVQNAAKVFHDSVLDSARVYQDTIEATKSEIKDIDDDDVEEEDEILATKSIDSLREELALADQSFDLQHSAASMMSAETVPIANLVHGTSVKILSHPTMVKRQHQKTIYLPFPWSTPELLFVPHNELRPPPEAVQCYLPQPVLEEKMMELDFRKKRARKQDAEADKEVVLESVPVSCITIPPHEVEASLPPPQPTEPSCETKDTLPPSAPPEPPPLSDDILSQSKTPEPPSKHRESLTFVSGDVAVLYRGTKPPPSSRRKRPSSFLSTLVRPFSSARSSSMDDYFCVDCGGPTIRCYCEAVIEKEQQRASRMESVYSIDVGNIVSDASAKFIMVRPSDRATKKTTDQTKKKWERTGKSLDTSGAVEKQTSTLPPSSKPPKQHIADRNDPPPEPDPLDTEAPSKISRSLSVKERNLLVPMPPDSKPAEAIHPEPLDSSMAEGKNEDDPLPPDSSKVEGNHMPDLEPSDCSTSESGTKVETSTSRTRKIGNTTRKDSPDPSQSPRSSPHRLSSSSRDRELAPLTVLKIGKAVIGSDVEDPPPPKGKQIKTKKKKKILRGIRKKVGRFMKRLGGSTKASF